MSAAILDLGERLNFDREQLRQALMAGSAKDLRCGQCRDCSAPKAPARFASCSRRMSITQERWPPAMMLRWLR